MNVILRFPVHYPASFVDGEFPSIPIDCICWTICPLHLTRINFQQQAYKMARKHDMDPAYRSSQDDSWSSDEPLMPDSEKAEELIAGTRKTTQRRLLWPWIFHALLFMSYSVAYLVAFDYRTADKMFHSVAYSPANGALRYRKVSYNGALHQASPYRGDPRPELDQAWADLITHNNVRLSKEELHMMNRTALELYDKSGYYGQLSAFHHLHCLKYICQVLHPEYYDTDTADRDEHVAYDTLTSAPRQDHCIDDIRQALMCHADTSIVTFDWKSPDWRAPWPNFSIDHTCADWDALDRWAAARSFSLFDQHSVVHPQLDKPFLSLPFLDLLN
ncbi:hypothetical protein PG994_005180 [Apiospora phragmitis]|uniref:Tat pathway signal sequence n=1 Tax=Apiospora phragmitis TaxID=2905665 RepID=A0ABR1VSM7_9PEZI